MYSQSHYVLGWLIVLISHNWPVMLALIATLISAVAVWRRPSRSRLAWLYGAALLVVTYEYAKHVAPRLQDAANYLLMFDLLWLNRSMWLLVGPIATALLLITALGFWGYAVLQLKSRVGSSEARLHGLGDRLDATSVD